MIKIKISFFFFVFLSRICQSIEPYKWMYHLPYGSTVHLQPLFNETECNRPSAQCYWLLPDGFTRLNFPLVEKFDSRYLFSSNGILTIRNIQSDDNGIYHFFRFNQSKWIVSKAFLNLRGAPFPSLWAQYWPNVVGGLVGMAAVFVTFALILLVNKHRYRVPARKTSQPSTKLASQFTFARTNAAFTNDDSNITLHSKRTNSRRSSSTSNATNLCVAQF